MYRGTTQLAMRSGLELFLARTKRVMKLSCRARHIGSTRAGPEKEHGLRLTKLISAEVVRRNFVISNGTMLTLKGEMSIIGVMKVRMIRRNTNGIIACGKLVVVLCRWTVDFQ